ncbi:hypothetical protein SBA2_10019 [Acidobacteriia bacterium SbA2]|nr:hypothetical protein SBA2_10019 [Acidobacteriia bacterium SbA2]
MIGFSPLPWGEGGESSEPGEGFLPTEPRNFGIRDKLGSAGSVAPQRPVGSIRTRLAQSVAKRIR